MHQHALAQMDNGIITMYVKTVTTNVEFVTPVPLIVPEKVNVQKIDLTHQPVIVTMDTMMMVSVLNVMFVTVNVPSVPKLDVLLAQVLEQEHQIVTVQMDTITLIP